MAKGKKKSSRKHTPTQIEKIVFATAILNLIKAIIDLIKEML